MTLKKLVLAAMLALGAAACEGGPTGVAYDPEYAVKAPAEATGAGAVEQAIPHKKQVIDP